MHLYQRQAQERIDELCGDRTGDRVETHRSVLKSRSRNPLVRSLLLLPVVESVG